MAEYHVGCGAFAIYAGTLNSRNKNMWQNKTECTDEALCAVRDYMGTWTKMGTSRVAIFIMVVGALLCFIEKLCTQTQRSGLTI